MTSTDKYTAPPAVRHAYADLLISEQEAREIARRERFPVEAIRDGSLQVIDGSLDDRDRPVFWKLSTKAGWIWIDAETKRVLRRLDAP